MQGICEPVKNYRLNYNPTRIPNKMDFEPGLLK
jgi:hypothetical protein